MRALKNVESSARAGLQRDGLFRPDERGGAHLGGAVERLLLVVALILLLLPLEHLPDVLECLVDSLPVAPPRLPHKQLSVCVGVVHLLELHRYVVVCLLGE